MELAPGGPLASPGLLASHGEAREAREPPGALGQRNVDFPCVFHLMASHCPLDFPYHEISD